MANAYENIKLGEFIDFGKIVNGWNDFTWEVKGQGTTSLNSYNDPIFYYDIYKKCIQTCPTVTIFESKPKELSLSDLDIELD